MRLDLFFTGCVYYRVSAQQGATLFEVLREAELSPKAVKRVEKTGDIGFLLPLHRARCFEEAAKTKGLQLAVREEKGAPMLLRRLIARPGLVIGLLLALGLFCGARIFLWDVRITGNEQVSSEELERELAAAGLSRGCFLPTLDRDAVSAALRQGDGRIAYATVNLVGTVAHVQVLESQAPTEALSDKPANLIAKCDGVVTMPLIFEGECLVAKGDVVRAGQLLASGIRDTQNHGYRITRAAGEVLARTVHTYSVTVPFAYEEKAYTGEVSREISLFFFGHAQKVFKSTGNNIVKCDIIEEIKWMTLPSGKRLPLGVSILTAFAYADQPATRTATQAREQAFAQLESLLAQESKGRVMLQKTTETRVDEDAITLICTVVYEENIASVSEFELTE